MIQHLERSDTAQLLALAPSVEQRIAIFFDWENLALSVKQQWNISPDPERILDELKRYGKPIVACAYADWAQPGLIADMPRLFAAGIEPVYIPGCKNSADVRMAVDATEVCAHRSDITTYVLVTGDNDLIHPLLHVKRHGHMVVVLGTEANLGKLLAAAADEVLLYERDIEPRAQARLQGVEAQPPALTAAGEVPASFSALPSAQQQAVLQRLAQVQNRSRYMSFNFMVGRLVEHSPIPNYGRDQYTRLLNELAACGLLESSMTRGTHLQTGAVYNYLTFSLNKQHPQVQALLDPQPCPIVAAAGEAIIEYAAAA